MSSITDRQIYIYISYVFDTKYCGFSTEIEYTSMNCYARRDMNFLSQTEHCRVIVMSTILNLRVFI